MSQAVQDLIPYIETGAVVVGFGFGFIAGLVLWLVFQSD